jgi:hypothetical protein
MEDKTKESISPRLLVLKGLIIIVALICIASAVAIAVWLNLSADEKSNGIYVEHLFFFFQLSSEYTSSIRLCIR